ncbi:septal ring factor EnvC (AmiA/AmiB activator) [Sphingomonas sp. PvP055]
MRSRTLVTLVVAGTLCAGSMAPAQPPADRRTELARARAQSAAAAARSTALERLAEGEQNQARQALAREAAVAARIEQAQADIVAGQAQVSIVTRLLDTHRTRLAAQQRPVARLLAALQALSQRPALLAVIQPGSLDDLVHVRAVLAGAMPVIRARTERVRTDLAQARTLQMQATLAGQALAESRSRLEAQRLSLSRLELAHRLRARALGRDAVFESDRAIALGETARELVDLMDQAGAETTTERALAALPGPEPRPGVAGATMGAIWPDGAPYRLPTTGKLVTGFGEVSDAGVRSRGLTVAPTAGAPVVAPAAGRVAFAGPFRGYGTIVILDHGAGWTSLVSGLGATSVAVGTQVGAGAPIGTAPAGAAPRVTVELRRRDRPVDLTPLLG